MVDFEALSTNFSPIEQFRAVEFDRDWNTRKTYEGGSIRRVYKQICSSKNGNIKLNAKQYSIGDDYLGLRGKSDFNGKEKPGLPLEMQVFYPPKQLKKTLSLGIKQNFQKRLKNL